MGTVWDPARLDATVREGGVAALLDLLDADLAEAPDRGTEVLREAVAMSAAVLVDDPAQLPAQLVGRLSGLDGPPEILTLVERLRAFAARRWLCPQGATLTAPGRRLRRVLRGTPDLVTAVAVSPDGRVAVSGSYGRDVRVWDLDRGLLLAQFTGERPGSSYPEGAGGDAIRALAVVGDTVWAASADRCVYRVDRTTGQGEMVVQGETDNLFAVALSADGGTLVAGPKDIWGGTDYLVQVWDLRRGERTRVLDGPGHPIEQVAVTPGGGLAAGYARAGALTVWDTATGTVRWSGVAGAVTALALSPDGRLLATGHESGKVQVRRSTADEPAYLLDSGGDGTVEALAFVDPHRLVVGTAQGEVLVRDLAAEQWTHRLASAGSGVLAVAATPDLDAVVTGCVDGATRCWDVHAPDGAPTAPRPAPEVREDAAGSRRVAELEHGRFGGDSSSSRHEVIAVAAAGRLAVAASRHWTLIYYRLGIAREETHVRLWDTASGELVRELAAAGRDLVHGGHVDTFRCVAIGEDGSLAAAGGDDRTLRVWDTSTGEQVAAFTGESAITACRLSPDGTGAVAVEATGRVHDLVLRAVRPLPGDRAAGDPEGGQTERKGHAVALGKKATGRTIEKYLERYGLDVNRLPGDQESYLAKLPVEGSGYPLTVTHDKEVGLLRFSVGGLLHATLDDTPADRVHGLLLALAVLDHRIPLGAFGYDPVDGAVALQYAMPLVSGELHYEDCEQVLVVLQNVLARHAADLRAVVAGERTAREILR